MSENMLFCLGEGKYESQGIGYQKNYHVFNKLVEKEEWGKIKSSLPTIKLLITHWIYKKDMTDDEKENNSIYKEIGGYLKRFSYEEAWKNWWEQAKQSDKDAITSIKYFDREIFKGITGIDVEEKKSLLGKTGGESNSRIIKLLREK